MEPILNRSHFVLYFSRVYVLYVFFYLCVFVCLYMYVCMPTCVSKRNAHPQLIALIHPLSVLFGWNICYFDPRKPQFLFHTHHQCCNGTTYLKSPKQQNGFYPYPNIAYAYKIIKLYWKFDRPPFYMLT